MRNDSTKPAGFTLIELMTVILIINILIAMLLPSIQAMRESMRRGQCQSNLSKIVLAVRGHEEALGLLPSGTVNPNGPVRNIPEGMHMGWTAQILPFMEQTPLYREIDFSKSVYDPANETAWQTDALSQLVCPSEQMGASPLSNYAACHDGVETPIDTDNRGTFFLNGKLRSRDIPDGASYTIWLGEIQYASRLSPPPNGAECASLGWMSGTPGTLRNTGTPINAAPFYADWPMPLDFYGQFHRERLPYNGEEKPGQLLVGGFASVHPGGANFALGDGQVRLLFETIDAGVFQKLGRRNDAGPDTLGD